MEKLSARLPQAYSQFFDVDATLRDPSLSYGIHHVIY